MSRFFYLFAILALLGVVSAQTTCGGEGFDVSSLGSSDLTFSTTGSTNYTYYIRPCGTVTSAPTSLCHGSSFCQANLAGNYSFNLATYNSTVAVQWLVVPGGVQQSIQDGDTCGGIPNRQTTLFFQCNAQATTAYVSAVAEVETCHYRATIQTSTACNGQALTGAQFVGESRISSVCGGGVYDLSSLSTQDVTFDTNTSSTTSGYLYVFRACGQVANPTCTSVGPSMLCQSYKNGAGSNLLATYNSSVPVTYTVLSNGLSMSLQDGTTCGAINAARESTINMICDSSATTPVFVSLAEVETCWYTATVRTSAVCNRIDSASGAAGTVTTSSTGGQTGGQSTSTGTGGGNSPVTPTNGASMISSSASIVVVAFAFIASLLL